MRFSRSELIGSAQGITHVRFQLKSSMTEEISKQLAAFQRLIGLVPWGVKLGHGSFLTLEFGKEITQLFRGTSHRHGEWHLWLRSCAWRIQRGGRILIASGDDREIIERAVNRLRPGALRKATVDSETLDIRLEFADGVELVAFANHRYRYEQWELFQPEGRVLIANAGGSLAEEAAGGLDRL
jgi:hypothetical protein